MNRGGRIRRVGDPLRVLAENMRADTTVDADSAMGWYYRMREVADRIDREHDLRMAAQRDSYRGMASR